MNLHWLRFSKGLFVDGLATKMIEDDIFTSRKYSLIISKRQTHILETKRWYGLKTFGG